MVTWSLPVIEISLMALYCGLLTSLIVNTGVVATYEGPSLIEMAIPASHRKMCGMCAETPVAGSPVVNSSACSSWSLSPPGTTCCQECNLCSECNSITPAAFSSDKLCGMLFVSAGTWWMLLHCGPYAPLSELCE